MRKLRGLAAMVVGAMGLLAPGLARAHFTLNAPMSYAQQGSLGVPEKSAPCGQADPGTPPVPTNVVTTFRPGQTISVSITEDVPHPGWYRAVLSQNGMNGLPADPTVTPTTGANGSACGTATAPPTDTIVGLTPQASGGQLLVDGALRHSGTLTPSTGSFNVTLPTNVTCTNCVLQIVEFMSNHGLNNPGGCFYHHCANIAIQGTPVDGGISGGTDAAADTRTGGTGGATGTGGRTGTGGSTAGMGGTSGGSGGGPGSTGSTGGSGGPTGAAGGTTGGAAGASGGEGGATGTGTGGSTVGDSGGGGCSCAVGGATNRASGLVGLLLAIFVVIRRRRLK
jgi:MYXO-CTERM domain-containing protein